MAQFAQPTPDENLVPGWNVQGNTTAGYAQSAPIPYVTNVGQATAGLPNPPGAANVGGENSGAYGVSALQNGSYSATPTTGLTQTATTPVPSTAGVQNPYGVNTTATIVIPTGVTAISVAPFTTGTPAYTAVWSGTSAAGQIVVVSIPPAGWVKMTGAAATSVTYTPTN